MSGLVMTAVLFAALLHASWNAIVKSGSDKSLDTIFVACGAGLLSGVAVLFVPAPAPASWPYLIVSAIVQLVYYALLAAAYRTGDMSHVYPVMRGTAPMLTAVTGTLFLSEHLAPVAWLGIFIICLGIVLLAADRNWKGRPGAPMGFALCNALVICAYTLIDGAGVRASGSAFGYVSWLCMLDGVALAVFALVRHRAKLKPYLRRRWPAALLSGAGAWASYALVLWAMTHAAIGVVAALRETAVLFGVGIAALMLNEHVSRARYAAALLVCAGAALLKVY